MTVVHLIDTVVAWARAHICAHIQLKQPPDGENAPNAADYAYRLVNPAAFGMYIPTGDSLPPDVAAAIPSLCVRLAAGQDNWDAGGFLDLQFCFSAWDTGLHGRDWYTQTGPNRFRRGEDGSFRVCGEGWRDAWNFVDLARRAVEQEMTIGGCAIDRATPVRFGPYTEQEAIPDLYPYWYAWLSFRVTYPLVRNNQDIQTFL